MTRASTCVVRSIGNAVLYHIILTLVVIDFIGYDAFFHGTIKLWYVHHWLMMGAALELVVLPYTLPLTETIASYLTF